MNFHKKVPIPPAPPFHKIEKLPGSRIRQLFNHDFPYYTRISKFAPTSGFTLRSIAAESII